jgi:multisubunit Na+/H+ antiporter MnhC subunit
MVRRTDGWRFWAVLAVGTVIGPMTILAFAVYQGLKSNSPLRMILFANDPMPNPLMLLAAGISFLTTLFFLLFLRHAQQIRKSERVGFMRGQLEVPDDFDRMHEGEIERLFDGRSDS